MVDAQNFSCMSVCKIVHVSCVILVASSIKLKFLPVSQKEACSTLKSLTST